MGNISDIIVSDGVTIDLISPMVYNLAEGSDSPDMNNSEIHSLDFDIYDSIENHVLFGENINLANKSFSIGAWITRPT